MKLWQPLKGAAESLFEYAQDVPVIDTHEHIPRSEKEYNEKTIRFGDLFNPYLSNDLCSAGMPFPEGVWPAFHCIEDDWDAFAPYWNRTKFGSYARPIRIALQKFYGVDDFTRENYLELVKRINAGNTPGIYHRVFREACKIEKAVRCAGDLPDAGDPIVVGNISSPSMMASSPEGLAQMVKDVGAETPKTLDDLIAASDRWMELQVERGAMEFKTGSGPIDNPDEALARETISDALALKPIPPRAMMNLGGVVREANARKAAKLGVPMAIHTGVWGDFRNSRVQDLIGFIVRNPGCQMDIYHLGIPEVRDAIQIVKNFPNAYLNLCWAHVVASDMVVQTMKEAVDMVPMNKIFAFGADYVLFIEKVYGHLHMARENVAIVLGDRVDRNLMSLDDAKEILHAWFYDNPKRLYKL